MGDGILYNEKWNEMAEMKKSEREGKLVRKEWGRRK